MARSKIAAEFDKGKGRGGESMGTDWGGRPSRRAFLRGIGVGAAGAAAVAAGVRPILSSWADLSSSNNFTRIFSLGAPPYKLQPFFGSAPTQALLDALTAIGAQGGILDANDQVGLGPVLLITTPPENGNPFNGSPGTNPDNFTHTAGTHFMGQFMDHDMTFDNTSTLGVPTNPSTSPNARIAYFDLDSVYGQGPSLTPQFYSSTDPVKLNIGFGGMFEDLPRDQYGTAIIPDPRNDENMMIAGLHCAFILFHNNAVDWVRTNEGLTNPADVFAEAKRLTTWHYQWMILHEFLPLFVGQPMVNDILSNGNQFYLPKFGQAQMPVEFQAACYRFGHSMVRPSYRANMTGNPNSTPFFGLIFDPGQNSATSDPSDLRGGFQAPRRFIGWHTFFNFSDGNVKPNKQIDTTISSPLFTLPLGTIPSHTAPIALPQRNLLRQVTWSLPSGQSIAQVFGVTPLTASELAGYNLGLDTSTPLWYYILKEAGTTVQTAPNNTSTGTITSVGLRLGPVGGRIVGEVIIGLLQSDPNSWVHLQSNWTPTLPAKYSGPGSFRMIDFLAFAGVDALR
jgi:hypothetical protein